MSKQLVLQKIEHLQNELINLKESVEMLGITEKIHGKKSFELFAVLNTMLTTTK